MRAKVRLKGFGLASRERSRGTPQRGARERISIAIEQGQSSLASSLPCSEFPAEGASYKRCCIVVSDVDKVARHAF